jgi:hypothetical protein
MQVLSNDCTPYSPSSKLTHVRTLSRLSPTSKNSFKSFPKLPLINSTELPQKKNYILNSSAKLTKWSPPAKNFLKMSAQLIGGSELSQKTAFCPKENMTSLLQVKEPSLLVPPQVDLASFKLPVKKLNVPKFLSKSK